MRIVCNKNRSWQNQSHRLKMPPLVMMLMMPLLINTVMAAVIWLHMRNHWGSAHVILLSAVLFFGVIPVVGLFLVNSDAAQKFREERRRSKLRVIRPKEGQGPDHSNR